MKLFTPERAEKLAKALERSGWSVIRLRNQPIFLNRFLGSHHVSGRVYAEVWKGRNLRLRIVTEHISEGSPLL